MQIEFDWDEANVTHIARHGVLPQEAEETYKGEPLVLGSKTVNSEKRLTLLGATCAGRLLVVVVTPRDSKIRVVTCYPADRKYRVFYQQVTGSSL